MPRACCLIRESPHYRRWSFLAGLQKAGYSVVTSPIEKPAPDDVLVIWNRYGTGEECAGWFDRAGATVLVCENGYCGRDGQGRQYYAIARQHHNGAGEWASGGPERWAALGIQLGAWRSQGEHILVCPSRGIGPRGIAMPLSWERDVLRDLRAHTRRPIRVRPHPGNQRPAKTLADDLANCWAVVIWNSAAGVHSLVAGVPVIRCARQWILQDAAGVELREIESPPMPERLPAFERLAWAQWTVEEIADGQPFRHLLSDTRQAEGAAAV